jgi:hypothetical protein
LFSLKLAVHKNERQAIMTVKSKYVRRYEPKNGSLKKFAVSSGGDAAEMVKPRKKHNTS